MAFRDLTERYRDLRDAHHKPVRLGITNLKGYLQTLTHRYAKLPNQTDGLSDEVMIHHSSNYKRGQLQSDDTSQSESENLLSTLSTHRNRDRVAIEMESKSNNDDDNDNDDDDSSDDMNISTDIDGVTDSPTHKSVVPPSLRKQLPPVWIDLLITIDLNIKQINIQFGQLRKAHRERLKIHFDDEIYSQQDRDIEQLTNSITELFRESQTKIKKIATKAEKSSDSKAVECLPIEERLIRFNAMRSRAVKIQNLTKVFRHAQRVFIQSLQKHESKGSKFIDTRVEETLPSFDKLESGFTRSQLQQLETIEKDSSQRTKEIIHIAKSVNELAQIFKELSVLIVEQGTILDRIDYNVDQLVANIKESHTHIKKAEQYQKKSGATLVIMILVILIVLALLVLIVKTILSS